MAQLHEYQAKEILTAHGIEIPRGRLAKTADEAREIAENLGGEVVVKAQIHSTSRFASGGIRFAVNAFEAENATAEMLGVEIAGNVCEAVLVDEKAEVEREFYLGFIVDTDLKRPTLLFSDAGGSGIEERGATLRKLVCSIRCEPTIEEIKAICGDDKIAGILQKLYRVAKSCEARTAEINPLALLKNGKIVALDARISVDDYAVFRHEDLEIEIARELGHAPTKLERIAWEIEREDFRGTFYFVEILDATDNGQRTMDNGQIKIGFHGAGGGGSMASLDAAQRNGLEPACFVDTSGNPPASKVYRAAKIILSIPNIRGYFLSGSGVASQEQFVLARGVIKAFREIRPAIPAVLRLGGNGEDFAKELVEKFTADLDFPVEAYRKKDSADFCAAQLKNLIVQSPKSKVQSQSEFQISDFRFQTEERTAENDGQIYRFRTRTGEIKFNHPVFAVKDAAPVVEACPVNILKLNDENLPVLAISREEAEKGKCIECLACEFADWENEIGGVKIEFPIRNSAADGHG